MIAQEIIHTTRTSRAAQMRFRNKSTAVEQAQIEQDMSLIVKLNIPDRAASPRLKQEEAAHSRMTTFIKSEKLEHEHDNILDLSASTSNRKAESNQVVDSDSSLLPSVETRSVKRKRDASRDDGEKFIDKISKRRSSDMKSLYKETVSLEGSASSVLHKQYTLKRENETIEPGKSKDIRRRIKPTIQKQARKQFSSLNQDRRFSIKLSLFSVLGSSGTALPTSDEKTSINTITNLLTCRPQTYRVPGSAIGKKFEEWRSRTRLAFLAFFRRC